MKESIRHIKVVVILVLIQFLLDMLYVYIYPTVNPIRATLIGFSALVLLFIPFIKNLVGMPSFIGFIPIYSSAFFGAFLVQADVVASKSVASGISHIVILIVTYVVIIAIIQKTENK